MNRTTFLLLLLLASVLRSTAQPAVVAATKMNVVYIGIPNPISVAACGYPEGAVSVTVDDGTLTKTSSAGAYDWMVTTPGTATVTVWGTKAGKKTKLTETRFRAKYTPDPQAVVGNKHDGAISKSWLQEQLGIGTITIDFVFDAVFKVKRFKADIFHNGTHTYEEHTDGPYFSKELKAQFTQLSLGDKVIFSEVYAIGLDSHERQINTIEFTVMQ